MKDVTTQAREGIETSQLQCGCQAWQVTTQAHEGIETTFSFISPIAPKVTTQAQRHPVPVPGKNVELTK